MLNPTLEEVNPLEILKAISDKKEQQLWPRSEDKIRDDNAGNRARLFTDLVKEDSNKIQLSESRFKEFEKLITNIEIPLTEEFVKNIINKFEEVAKELTGDDKDKGSPWNKFWNDIKQKYELSDEEIKMRQGDVINAYRMKIFALAQKKLEVDITTEMNKVTDKTGEEWQKLQERKGKILLAKDTILKINIAARDARNESVMEHLTNFYQNKFAVNVLLKYEINEMINKATAMVKEGKTPDEVKEFIRTEREKEWQKLIETPLGDPNGEKYLQLFGKEKAKELYDKYFSEEKIYEKVENYAKVSKELGFDINDRIKMLEGLLGSKEIDGQGKNSQAYLGDMNKNRIRDYVVTLSQMVYFPKKDIKQNDDILNPTTRQEHDKDAEKLKEIINGCTLGAIQQKDIKVLTLCINTGIVSKEPTTNYKRDFGTRLRDGFKGFPRNLGKLVTTPPRTIGEIAKLYGEPELAKKITEIHKQEESSPSMPIDMLKRLSTLEDKVHDLEQKVVDTSLMQNQRVLLPEMTGSQLVSQFGERLAKNEEFIEAIKSKDPEKMEKQFVESLMAYGAYLFSSNHDENTAQFKKVVDGLASCGCTSALFFRAQAMLGNNEVLKNMTGIDMPKMYEENHQEGSRELSKVPPDSRISVHPNVRDNSKMSMSELVPESKVVPLKETRKMN